MASSTNALRQHGKHGDKLAQFGHVHGLAVGVAGSDVLPALLGKVLNNSHQRIDARLNALSS